MSANQSQHYQTQQIMTASPAMLVYLLFDKAIGCLKEAVRAIEAGEIEARWKANGRAMEIIEHLQLTLNMEAGGEIAQNLDRIYGLLLRELPKVDLKNNPAPAREGIKLLEPLRDSWRVLAGNGEETARQTAQAATQMKSTTSPSPRPDTARPAVTRDPAGAGPAGIKISA